VQAGPSRRRRGYVEHTEGATEVGETAQTSPAIAGEPPGGAASESGSLRRLRDAGIFLARQREATVFIVVVLLIVYFGFISSVGRSTFFTKIDLINLSQIAAPIIIISLGEVLLLICGEIDLSVGFIYALAPFIMFYLNVYYGVPGVLAIILALVFGLVVGWINAFFTVTLRLPSFVTTLGTGFVLAGLTLTFSHGEQASVPPAVLGIGHWIGTYAWAEISWAVALGIIFHILLRRTRWGLHTIAVGGNALGAAEAGVNVARIKYGNFMLTGMLGAFVGIQIAFQTNLIDTFSGGAAYQPMFYAIAAAVIGGTAMLGGSGTMIGAFLGAVVLAVLIDGFSVVGISAYPLDIYFGGAILLAMIANVQLARLRAGGRIR
jgi:simple sugar transport system permease protein